MNLEIAQQALKQYFGYDSFRPMQAEIIQSVFNKKDALVLMPTGGGKSICFQIPAITMKGVCIVLSPLIALMKDQVEGLRANGIDAAFLNSSLSSSEQRRVEDDLLGGRIKLLYVSPEKIVSGGFLPLMRSIDINLFAIDEAHCISSWGHDFRPEYTRLGFLKKQFPDVPLLALTATADKVTRRDICKQLAISDAGVFIDSFNRANLSLTVLPAQKRIEHIVRFIKDRPNQSGIIYCLSRKNTEKIAQRLKANNIKAEAYHAGMGSNQRSKIQEAFITDALPIVVATIAFGMGIDKSNVRWVMHYNLPKNIESYYQEIGRAGRDGVPSDTILFYSYADVMMMRDMLNQGDNAEVKLAKLERIKQYAEALICRRKILLSYFGETLEKDCGNCDVCKNPPQHFDGTVLAQKALSALVRLKEGVGITMLIDVLRGSGRAEVLRRGFDKIKTYGAGAAHSAADWQQFIIQMLNTGLMDIAYDENNVLKITEEGKIILFGNKKLQLVKMSSVRERLAERKKKPKTKRQKLGDELFETLRDLRLKIARSKDMPAYLVLTDATLTEMAQKKPVTPEEMRDISGIGEKKMELYGQIFMDVIIDFLSKKSNLAKGSTQKITYNYFKQGLTVDEIAAARELKSSTIYSHLAVLYEQGEAIDLTQFVSKTEGKQILEAIKQQEEDPIKLSTIFEHFNEAIPYHKIRLMVSYYKRHFGGKN